MSAIGTMSLSGVPGASAPSNVARIIPESSNEPPKPVSTIIAGSGVKNASAFAGRPINCASIALIPAVGSAAI